tara:strand:+ start:28601 stop:29086 length:486 start_codon:yes stop_codon:yes gene_type:complete
MEKLLNIYFYNFCLLDRFLSKLIAVYLNPFVWISNFNKRKLGSKLFFEHMEKNFPTFLNYYKYDSKVKIFFIPFLILVNLFIFNALLFILRVNISKYFFLVLIASSTLSLIEAYIFLFNENKYQEYLKEFTSTKKYDFPLITFLSILAILFLWIYIIFFLS